MTTEESLTSLRQTMELYCETVRKLESIVRLQQDRLAALEARLPRVEGPVGGHSADRPIAAVEAPRLASAEALAGAGVVVVAAAP